MRPFVYYNPSFQDFVTNSHAKILETVIWFIYSVIFCISIWLMRVSTEWVIGGLMRLSKALRVREFVVGFCVMAAAASLPNLFVGITSATRGIPELSLGDVFGNNFVAMTLAVAVAIFFSPKKEIEADGRTVQTTAFFTMGAAILPLVLLLDGVISRADGVVLLGAFFGYFLWLVSQQEKFSKIYNHDRSRLLPTKKLKRGIKDIGLVTAGIALLIVASVGIVLAAKFFTVSLGVPLLLVGILITGLGNALPEIYFAVASSKRGETQMIIGNLMGAVIFPATLVLGIVALIHPISTANFEFALSSRIFLLIAAILFFIFARTKEKISRGEGIILMALYVFFIIYTLV